MSFTESAPALNRISQLQSMMSSMSVYGSMPLGGFPAADPLASSSASGAASAQSVAQFEQLLQTATDDTGGLLATQPSVAAQSSIGLSSPGGVQTGCPECSANGVGRASNVIGSTKLDWNGTAVPANTPYGALFEAAGAKYGVDPKLLAAVAEVESSFDPTVTSPAGAQGLMQFMPGTASSMGVNPWDPASAIDGAARYLKESIGRFGLAGGLAAYNIGSGAVARNDGRVGSAHGYVDKVLSRYERGVM
jgi:membrane-bound lytic murein transglycosylase B